MNLNEAIITRHSVRDYIDRPLSEEIVTEFNKEIAEINEKYNLHIQLMRDHPEAFSNILARYGKFKNVRSYFAMVAKNTPENIENLGYWGQHLVLKAQTMGLNTCWVSTSYSKKKAGAVLNDDEVLICLIAVGYGKSPGKITSRKPLNKFYIAKEAVPPWFIKGVEAARLAPTVMNQQKFVIILEKGEIILKSKGGIYPQLHLGIVKYNFEVGSGIHDIKWGKEEIEDIDE